MIGLILVALGEQPAIANHNDPKPATVTAWYVDTVSQSILYDMGCDQANRVDSNTDPNNGIVILAFGTPVAMDSQYGTNGASMFSGDSKGTWDIREGVNDYSRGFYNCLAGANRASTLYYVGVGVTNAYPGSWTVNRVEAHASAWADLVAGVRSYQVSQGYSGDILARGAADIEPNYGGVTRSRHWVDEYDANPDSSYFYNFGGAAGCPWFGTGGTSCNNGWTQGDIYHVSWGAPAARATPEIYRTDGLSAEQWVNISQWGNQNQGVPIYFDGPLSQSQACNQVGTCTNDDNTSTQAWNQMVNKMDAKPPAIQVDMSDSLDIKWRSP